MTSDDAHDDRSAMRVDPRPPDVTRSPLTLKESAALDTPPTEWGVEYRFSGESDTRTHLHIPEPPSRDAAIAYADRLTAEGGYDLVAVVRLPYDTK